MIFVLIGFESLYPSDEPNFHATGLRQSVNRGGGGHRASPCGSPLSKQIGSDRSNPVLVLATTLVFQHAQSLPTTSQMQSGNL